MEDCYPRVAIGFATCGRAPLLLEALSDTQRQIERADHIFVCYTRPEDIIGVAEQPGLTLLQSQPGLPKQRNEILRAARDHDVILFLDDDFLVDVNYCATLRRVFRDHADIVVATGTPYADGTRGPGISLPEARALNSQAVAGELDLGYDPAPHGYGCNMAVRVSAARTHDVWFDERLPLYAWSEDVDFSHRLGRFGRMVKLRGTRGVHLGTKTGRSPGRRLGYSQVANPLYLRRKGSYSWRRALGSVGRNLAMNMARAAWQEPFVDRRGRLKGNLLAFADLCLGRMRPERILDL